MNDDFDRAAVAVLERLLEAEFAGRDELKRQAAVAQKHIIISGGAPALVFTFDKEVPKANVRNAVPVEGSFRGDDGERIHCLLHVSDGRLAELEFYREDGSPIPALLDLDRLEVLPPE